MERQVRWNWSPSKENEEWTHWKFLVINDKREILRIMYKVWRQLEPIIDLHQEIKGEAKGGLYYQLFEFDSPKSKIRSHAKIYQGRWTRDRELYDRKDPLLLEAYIARHFARDSE